MIDYSWCSFATDDGPLGVVFTAMRPGEDDSQLGSLAFVSRLHRQGINPGGEVQWMTAPEEVWASQPGWEWLSQNAERLLTPLELVEVGYLKLSDFGPEGRAQIARQLAEVADPDTGIQHAEGECTVCDRARAASRILAAQLTETLGSPDGE